MSSDDTMVRIRNLGKRYVIRHDAVQHSTLGEALVDRLRHPLRRSETEEYWALADLSLDVRRGEVLGIIGRNGAGKSTLLKVLSRITAPTRGRIELYGRVGSLLEVGTGFHPELTGRENIYLNGAILGMRKREITRQFDEIVAFAGVEQFLDTPVKRYSSGMYVRLAFAVAAHLDTEILLVDEVLAVGDLDFQRKCLRKMSAVAAGGRTILFVSHHMQSIERLCTQALCLEGGRAIYHGAVPGAIERYTRSFGTEAPGTLQPERRGGTGELRITHAGPAKEVFTCAEDKILRFRVERRRPFGARHFVSAHIVSSAGTLIAQCDSRLVGGWLDPTECYEGEFRLRTPWLKPDTYRVDLFVCSAGVLDRCEDACRFEVLPRLPYPATAGEEATRVGTVFADFSFTSSQGLSESSRLGAGESAT